MNRLRETLLFAFVITLVAGASSVAAQEIALTRANDGDLQARYDGEEQVEFVLVTATVDREGNVLERNRGPTIVLKPGEDIGVPSREFLIGFGSFDIVSDPEPYTAGPDGLPGGKYFLLYEDELDTPKDDGERTPRKGVVAAGPSGTGKTMDGDDAKERTDERGVRIQSGRMDDKRSVGINPGRFLIVTLVPTDPAARRSVAIRPLIVDLDATAQTGNPLLERGDKRDR